MLDEKIIELKKEIVSYGDLVGFMIERSINGLIDSSDGLLLEVINVCEPKANNLEIELDESCTSLIAQFEPKAKELRTILMVMKMNNDFERIGDHAVNIAESSMFLINKPPVKPLIDIPRMTDLTIRMLKDGLTAFIDEDKVLAKKVCERDSEVDSLKEQILRELITFMTSDATKIESSLHLLRIANNLERIADLSTNICEDVIFMAEGKVIKHNT